MNMMLGAVESVDIGQKQIKISPVIVNLLPNFSKGEGYDEQTE